MRFIVLCKLRNQIIFLRQKISQHLLIPPHLVESCLVLTLDYLFFFVGLE